MDINKASAEELTTIAGINQERARLIAEYRDKNGPFRSWEDLEKVPGIGAALSERIRESATLQADGAERAGGDKERRAEAAGEEGGGAGAEADEEEGDVEVIEEIEEEEEIEVTAEDELEALIAVGQLDLEAAAAYDIAAEAVDDPKLNKMLLAFGGDHRRHVDALQELLKAREVEAEIRQPDPERSVFIALASSLANLDPDAVLEAMISNEQLTNGTYETALWVVTDEEALEVVKRNREDERRHLESLLAYARRDEELATQGRPRSEEQRAP